MRTNAASEPMYAMNQHSRSRVALRRAGQAALMVAFQLLSVTLSQRPRVSLSAGDCSTCEAAFHTRAQSAVSRDRPLPACRWRRMPPLPPPSPPPRGRRRACRAAGADSAPSTLSRLRPPTRDGLSVTPRTEPDARVWGESPLACACLGRPLGAPALLYVPYSIVTLLTL